MAKEGPVESGANPEDAKNVEYDTVSGNGGSGCSVVVPTDLPVIIGHFGPGNGSCHKHGSPK